MAMTSPDGLKVVQPRPRASRGINLRQTLELQDYVHAICVKLGKEALAVRSPNRRAVLAGAVSKLCQGFDTLAERVRILRGSPLPGQLRPDMDPVQLAKMAKRLRRLGRGGPQSGRLIELSPSFSEEDLPPAQERPGSPGPGRQPAAPKSGDPAIELDPPATNPPLPAATTTPAPGKSAGETCIKPASIEPSQK